MCSKTDKAKTRKMIKQHAVLVTVSTCQCFPENSMVNENQEHRNTEYTGGTAEHPGIVAEQPNITRNTGRTPRNNGTIQNEEQLQCFKRKFKTQNSNFQLKVETIFIADMSYLFIYFSLFKVGYHVVKKIN